MWSKPLVPLKKPGLESNTLSEESREKGVHPLRMGGRNNGTKNGHNSNTKMRGNIKFRPLGDDSTDSDTEEECTSKRGTHRLYPWLPGAGPATLTHSLTPTILDEGARSHADGLSSHLPDPPSS